MPKLLDDPEAGHPEHAAPLRAGSPGSGAGDLIHSAAPSDAPRLAALYASSFDDRVTEDGFAALLASPGVWGLMTPESFVVVRSVADEAEILWIAVSPAARRQGLASALWETARERLVQGRVRRVFLEVSSRNVAALAFYRRRGFEEVGRRRTYYADGTDALVLAVDLECDSAGVESAGQQRDHEP